MRLNVTCYIEISQYEWDQEWEKYVKKHGIETSVDDATLWAAEDDFIWWMAEQYTGTPYHMEITNVEQR